MTTPAPNNDLVRPIVGIENRTPQEVFDIMADRVKRHSAAQAERISVLERALEEMRVAISWIEPPFVDDLTPHQELRFRVNQCVKDAARTTLTGAR